MEDPDADTTLKAEFRAVQWFNITRNSWLRVGSTGDGLNQRSVQ